MKMIKEQETTQCKQHPAQLKFSEPNIELSTVEPVSQMYLSTYGHETGSI